MGTDLGLSLMILVFAIIIVWLMVYFYTIHTHISDFPVPPFVPVFGHVFDYTDPYKAIIKLTNNLVKHGGTIRQFIGPRKPSLVTASKDFLQFLCNNRKYVSKAKYYRYMKVWLGEGLITSDGIKWLLRRKALTSSFAQTAVLKSFVETFEEKSEKLIEFLKKQQEESINLHPTMKKFTLNVLCATAFGVSLDDLPDPLEYAENIEIICEIIQRRMTSYLKNYDFFFQFSKDCLKLRLALAVMEGMLAKIITRKNKEKRNKEKKKSRKDVLDLLMEIEINGKALSDDDLREEINTFTFAGYDTSSSAMSLALYEIARHPEIQQKIFDEQKKVFKKDFKNPKVSYEKLQEMTYLEMVIKETLRLHTIVPCIGRKVTKDLKYGQIKIPSMLNINICIYAFHHNPNYFKDPKKFIPERFSDASKIDKSTYIPFGFKPRQCLGKNFAMLEMKSVLAKIIRNFEVGPVEDHQLMIQHKLVLFSTSGIWVKLKKRSAEY